MWMTDVSILPSDEQDNHAILDYCCDPYHQTLI